MEIFHSKGFNIKQTFVIRLGIFTFVLGKGWTYNDQGRSKGWAGGTCPGRQSLGGAFCLKMQ